MSTDTATTCQPLFNKTTLIARVCAAIAAVVFASLWLSQWNTASRESVVE